MPSINQKATAPAVMHLIDTGGPGGAETVFAHLAHRIETGVIRPLTIVPREGWLSVNLRSLGMEPLILDSKGSLNTRYASALLKIVKQHHVKLIHTHLLGSAVYGSLIGLLTKTPVIAVLHGPTDLKSPGKFAFVKRWIMAHGCSAIVAVSSSTYNALLDFGLKPSSITLIQNGVDTTVFSPGIATDLRDELGLKTGDLLIGAVGNIRGPKAYDVLLRASAIVLKQVPYVHFVVVGQGDDHAMLPLLQLRDSLGLNKHFHFLGFRKSTSTLYRNLDVFVSSSRTEGLSLSFLEAMATGRAIVATRSGGAEEAIGQDDTAGLLAPIEDAAALATILERVLVNTNLRATLGNEARRRVVSMFSLDSTVGKYEKLYRQLL